MKKFVFALIAVAVLVTPVALIVRMRAAERDWASSFGPIDDVPRRFRTEENATARELPKWTARLFGDLPVPDPINDYVLAQDVSASPNPQPNAFTLDYRRADVDAFADWVNRNPVPVFEAPFDDPAAPIPNRLRLIQLQKLLTGAAMARAAAGDHVTPERLLDAAWKLNAGLRKSAVLIDQLIAMANFRIELGAIRKVGADATKWVPRLRQCDYVESIARAETAWAWHEDRMVRDNVYARGSYLASERAVLADLGEPIPDKPQWLQLLRTPMRWFDLPAVLEGQREMLLSVARTPRAEDIDTRLSMAYRRGFRRWSYIPDPDVKRQNLGSAYRRAVRTLAERELTEKILLARSARARGSWPAAIDVSSSLDDATWVYERTATGAEIKLSREISWGMPLGMQVPLRYDLQ